MRTHLPRILLVSDAYPPMIGGADRAVQALAHELDARGHAVMVAAAWQPRLLEQEDDHGVPVRRVRDLYSRVRFLSDLSDKHVPAPLPDPEAALRLRSIIRRFAPDLVHSYGWITYSCALALLGTRLPLLVSTRDYAHVCPTRTLMYKGREACSGPGASKCIGCAASTYGPAKAAVAVAGVLGGRRFLIDRIAGLHYNSRFMRCAMHEHLLKGNGARRRA